MAKRQQPKKAARPVVQAQKQLDRVSWTFDPEIPLLGDWYPFLLRPPVGEERPQPEVVEVEVGSTGVTFDGRAWPVDDVLRELVYSAAYWHTRATAGIHAPRHFRSNDDASRNEVDQWVALTLSVAERIPFGTGVKGRMRAIAREVDEMARWPDLHCLKRPRSLGTKEDFQFRASVNIWALDVLARAMNQSHDARANSLPGGAEDLQVTLAKFWSEKFEWYPADLPRPAFAHYIPAQKRIDRFESNIRPGHGPALMAAILREKFVGLAYRLRRT